jgi:flagellar basal-body rod modification protein FlgD
MEIGSTNATQSRDEFMNLLVAQLRNQDPLEPVKQENFLAQLAQFSTLAGVEELNANFESQISMQQDTMWMEQLSQASSLIGKAVTYKNDAGEQIDGQVNSVQINPDGFSVIVGDQKVDFDRLVQVGGSHTSDSLDAENDELDLSASQSDEKDNSAQSEENTNPITYVP